MGRYLDKFRSTMPAIQGKQIIQLLSAMKDSGSLRTIAEYNAKLQELSQYLRSTNPQPFFKFFEAKIGDVIASDTFNAMVKSAQLDLEAAFNEAETIAQVLELHKQLFKLTVLKSMEQSLDDLEKAISQYEFLNSQIDKWDYLDFNTFNALDGGILSRELGDSSLFYDIRRRQSISADETCSVDIFGQQLEMPLVGDQEVKITNITVTNDAETSISMRNVGSVTGNLQNVRDGQKLTYWLYPVILDAPVTGGIRMKLCLDLGGLCDLNVLQIEPASPLPMILEKISYCTQAGVVTTVTLNQNLTKDSVVNLGHITTSAITLTFKQIAYEATKYHYVAERNIWEKVWTDPSVPGETDYSRLDQIAPELNDILQESEVIRILDIPDRPTYQEFTVYQYTFGFDNIRCYLKQYGTRGLFVSKPLRVQSPGLIGLRTTETIPTTIINNLTYEACALEYYIVKQNYDMNDRAIDRETIPILPATSGLAIKNEWLLVDKNDDSAIRQIGSLRFVPDLSVIPVVKTNLVGTLSIGPEESADFVVRRVGGEWRETWAELQTDIENASGLVEPPIEIQIKLHNPGAHTIYTVDYTASTRNSDLADALQRDILPYVLMQDNTVLRCLENHGIRGVVAYSDIYLVLIMRNNSFNNKITPVLQDYKLLVSSYNSAKFVE